MTRAALIATDLLLASNDTQGAKRNLEQTVPTGEFRACGCADADHVKAK